MDYTRCLKRIDVCYSYRPKRIDVGYSHCPKRMDVDYTHCPKRIDVAYNHCPKRIDVDDTHCPWTPMDVDLAAPCKVKLGPLGRSFFLLRILLASSQLTMVEF